MPSELCGEPSVKVIEFLGVPGSGKSTLATALVESLPGAQSLEEAVRAAIAGSGEDPLARSVARLARSPDNKAWAAAYARAPDRFSALTRFIVSNPKTLTAVSAIQESRAERDLQPAVTLSWILNLMARYQLATEAMEEGTLVVDEGFAQRGVALLAGGFIESDLDFVPEYVAATPRPYLLVVVDTPVDVCAQRLDERGWSERLAGSGNDVRNRFLQASSALTERIAAHEESSGAEVIWVSGTTPAPDSVDRIAATLTY
jgi:thymidylate kinase